jgi:ribonuclease P protein component
MVRGGPLSLRYIQNTREQKFRVAVVVSRKVSKSAVVRNRIRRRIYEIVRLVSGRIVEPYDLVFTAYDDSTATVSQSQLERAVIGSLEKAGVLQKSAHNRSDHAIVETKERSA